jgi:excisionase family DNA binding protein
VSRAKAQAIVANDEVAVITQSREFTDRIAAEVFRGVVAAVQGALRGETAAQPVETTPDVMTADDVAAFLGVDRTTVYDFAGRGVIPHQRLGKRLLFRRGALVSWLDSSLCKATLTRKG